MDEKHIFNFFTDEGILPNYAFPESGVKLEATIYRKLEKKPEPKYRTIYREFERYAQNAIHEFAPGNYFYADGRRLPITQIKTRNMIERWHFCQACSYVEKATTSGDKHYKNCPKCDDPGWQNDCLTRNVIRMSQVYSVVEDATSREGDDRDERDIGFFNQKMLADFSPDYLEKAFKVDDPEFPFGYDYYRRATFREVNFGNYAGQDSSNTIKIAGQETSRHGFQVCKFCGAVKLDEAKFNHAASCPGRDKGDTGNFMECVYLYREFESEALRLLLPLDELDFSNKINSFIAAFLMGLKVKFAGNVDHLEAMVYTEPVKNITMRKKYIVLYDRIPGGTGYLKQLVKDSSSLMELFRFAYDKLLKCVCNTEEAKDGCYSCLYAHRVSRDIPHISRDAAKNQLHLLLEQESKLIQTQSINDISVNCLLESELEKRFIDALSEYAQKDPSVSFSKGVYNGKVGYRITLNKLSYKIVPQVDIGEKDGVAVSCRADFVIYPLRSNPVSEVDPSRGKSTIEEGKNIILPIVVFTDGYQFHGEFGETYNFPKDLAQRMALVRSGKFLCWSLSYDDVMAKFGQEHDNTSLIAPGRATASSGLNGSDRKNPLDLLLELLSNPQEKPWRDIALNYASALYKSGSKIVNQATELQETWDYWSNIDALPQTTEYSDWIKFGITYNDIQNGTAHAELLTCVIPPDNAMKIEDIYSRIFPLIRVHDQDGVSNDDFKVLWNRLLQAYNLLQFLPNTVMVTDRFISEGFRIPKLETNEVEADWEEIQEIIPPVLHKLLRRVKARAWECPVPAYELLSSDGEVIASATLAWEERKIAVLFESEDNSDEVFQEQGWKVVSANEHNADQVDKLVFE